MLGNQWRLRASNTQNQAITVTVKARLFKFASDGSLSWSAEQTLISAVSVAATTGTTVSATVDNTTDKYLGAELTCEMTAAVATNGTGVLLLTLERSTDGGATWATQELGQFVGAHTLSAADSTNARRKNYLIR
jgi:hypothetical protein